MGQSLDLEFGDMLAHHGCVAALGGKCVTAIRVKCVTALGGKCVTVLGG